MWRMGALGGGRKGRSTPQVKCLGKRSADSGLGLFGTSTTSTPPDPPALRQILEQSAAHLRMIAPRSAVATLAEGLGVLNLPDLDNGIFAHTVEWLSLICGGPR